MTGVGSRVGDYTLEAALGEGGMGVVFKARQLRLDRTVALKMLPFGRFSPDVHQKRFQVEAQAVARLRHPNIVTIYEVGEHDGQPFLSMEFVDGPDLGKVLQSRAVPIREAARLIERVAHAIQHAHGHGIAHRDLKPSNILLDADGEPRVTDFGLAKNLADAGDVTLAGQAFGSPNYMPPEQAAGKRDANPFLSDVYGLGAILYHLLTRRPPFEGASIPSVLQQVAGKDPIEPRLLQPELPRDLQTLCLKCLEKDPARRYASAGELATELGRFLRDEPIHARPIGRIARTWRWCRRRPALATMAAVTTMALCGGLAVSLTQWQKAQQRARQAAESLLRVELERVEDLFDRGDSAESLARLARLLRSNPNNAGVAQRAISALTHRNFILPASPEFENVHDGAVSPLAISPQRIVAATDGGKLLVVWDVSAGLTRSAGLPLDVPARVAAINADGTRVGVVLRDRRVQFWNVNERAMTAESARLPLAATSAQFDPGGSRLLVNLVGRGVVILDAKEGRLVKHLPEPHFAEMSPDGRWFVAVTNTAAALWNLATCQPADRTWRHAYRIESARFSADSARVVTTSADTSARLWDVHSGEAVGRPLIHQEHVLDAVFSPDGQRVLTRVLSQRGQLWDAMTGSPIGTKFTLARTLSPAQFSPDGLSLVTQFSDRVEVRDAFSGDLLAESIVTGQTSSARFLPDGGRILTTRFSGATQLWSLRPGHAAPLVLPHNLDLVGAVFSPDGTKVLTASKDQSAQLWSTADGRPLTPRLAHQRRLTRAALSADGKLAATGDGEGNVRIWDAETGSAQVGPLKLARDVSELVFSRDGRQLIAVAGGSASVWDTGTGKLRFEWPHRGAVRSVAVSPVGERCVIAAERSAQLWDLSTGERIAAVEQNVAVTCVAFSPDGKLLATGDAIGRIRFWSTADQRESTPSCAHTGAVTAIRFSADGKTIATASVDHTARVWNVATRQPVTRPLVHRGEVTTASVNPDGRFVLTASIDGTARIWSLATSLPVTDPLVHGNRVESAEWSPDGRRVVTSSWDASGRIWTLPFPRTSPGTAAQLADIAEAFGGLRLSRDEIAQRVTRDRLDDMREQVEAAEGDSDFRSWAQWLLDDRARRPLAPGGAISAGEHARSQFTDNKPDRVRQALQFAPMDSRGLARWSRLVLQQTEERNPRKFAEALATAELATRIDPGCFDAWCSLAHAELATGKIESARAAIRRAVETRPEILSPADQRHFNDLRRRIDRAAQTTAPGAR
jgi:WD40 repeat protein/predicted Ser/Thr protein kinase